MPCSANREPLCESPFDATLTGCCADGRRCDEICIAIAAAEECKRVSHNVSDAMSIRDTCQKAKDSDSYTKPEPPSTTQDLTLDGPNLDHKDPSHVCASEPSSGCCDDQDCEQDRDEPLTGTIVDACCKPIKVPVNDVKRDKAAQKSRCCNTKSTHAGMRSIEKTEKVDMCCVTKTKTCASMSSSTDISIVEDFQEACSVHLAKAMKKYKAFLEAGICICRNVLREADTCCNKASRTAITKKRKTTPATTKSCCAHEDSTVERCKAEATAVSEQRSCCSRKPTVTTCGKVEGVPRTSCSSQKDSCGVQKTSDTTCEPANNDLIMVRHSLGKSQVTRRFRDPEDNAAREHITFNITGMTCSGCVKKVTGALANVDGIENPRVNFVAAIADIDVDATKVVPADILLRLEKETGFKCSRIISHFQALDLRMSSAAARVLEAEPTKGIESIERVGENTYRISYNPLLVGARTVLARSGGCLAPPSNDTVAREVHRALMLKMWLFLGAAVFTIPVCVLAFADIPLPILTKTIVELVLATFVQLIAIPEFYVPALKALIFSKVIEMDMLVVISVSAAYCYSVVAFSLQGAGIDLEQGAIFETSTLLVTLVLLGRLIASYAKVKAVQAVSLKSLQVETALLEDAQGQVTETDARLLELNDVIHIPAHSKIVSDGQVVAGESAVDESMLTGESLPVPKATGDMVTAGTLNDSGVLRIRLTRLPGKNSITDIAELVQNALNSKPRVQDLADVVAGYFVPVVVSIATVTLVVWVAVAARIRNQNAGGAIGMAITYAIAVLAISCPCALGMAVPLVLVVAGGVAARGGVIIKQADATERGFRVTDIVFDKTGTLTTGRLEVVQQTVHYSDFPTDQVLAVTYSLVKDDAHPVAQAVAAWLKSRHTSLESIAAVRSVPGCGVEAMWRGQQAKAGNPYWLGIETSAPVADIQADGHTILCVTIGTQLVISFSLEATLRAEAQSVISALQKRGLTCHVVSGDQPTTVLNVAASLGIHVEYTASRQSPANKQEYIQKLRSAGKRSLFVGDGTNDAVAIAAANVGVQIGTASDVTSATADVVLLGGLEGIVTLLEVSRQSFYRIVFNFVWSGAYNVSAILFASGAFVKVRIAPNYAGLGEVVSVLPVVFAALTMLRVKARTY